MAGTGGMAVVRGMMADDGICKRSDDGYWKKNKKTKKNRHKRGASESTQATTATYVRTKHLAMVVVVVVVVVVVAVAVVAPHPTKLNHVSLSWLIVHTYAYDHRYIITSPTTCFCFLAAWLGATK